MVFPESYTQYSVYIIVKLFVQVAADDPANPFEFRLVSKLHMLEKGLQGSSPHFLPKFVIDRQVIGGLQRGAIAVHPKPWCDGMIRFGSRTELLLPTGTEINVKKGDHVKGGQTVIGFLVKAAADVEDSSQAENVEI